MNDLVGIIRTADGAASSRSSEIEKLKERAKHLKVEGAPRSTTPAGTSSIDLHNMLLVSECIAKAALSAAGVARRAHPRRLPRPDAEWGTKNLVLTLNATGDGVDLAEQPLPVMPDELKAFFEDK